MLETGITKFMQQGEPRYASRDWVTKLVGVASGKNMNLAAHLCGQHANELLDGDDAFVKVLLDWGFQRSQINATAINGVDMSFNPSKAANNLISIAQKYPAMEFIIQQNEETRPLWQEIIDQGAFPANISMLLDESKGTGTQMNEKSLPPPPSDYNVGYAGGIGPSNIQHVLKTVLNLANGKAVWIDMESSLRSINDYGVDIFDLDKCNSCITSALKILEAPI